jgi:hypothetical protein
MDDNLWFIGALIGAGVGGGLIYQGWNRYYKSKKISKLPFFSFSSGDIKTFLTQNGIENGGEKYCVLEGRVIAHNPMLLTVRRFYWRLLMIVERIV